ncbi:MAG: TIM barrel protein [Phycisphaerales bacterium]
MILTLSARCLRSMLLPPAKGKRSALDILDLPKFTRETLGLSGVNLSTDLLVGADRARLENIRERADKASCACLLLVEHEAQAFGHSDESKVAGAVKRARAVVEAAQILGCSAAAIKVAAPNDEAAMARVAAALKPVVERAEKLDINLLISPHDGLTAKPERVTDLLKKVGGFRIGTYPDFEVASQSEDPVAYLHRLTPYATAVCAATVRLLDQPLPPPKPAKQDNKKLAASPAAPAGGKKKTSSSEEDLEDAMADIADVDDDEDEALDDAELDELERMIDEAIDDDAPPPLVAMQHQPYDLRPLVAAIANVGFDGPLSLEYRGTGDLTEALTQSRDTFLALLAEQKRGV